MQIKSFIIILFIALVFLVESTRAQGTIPITVDIEALKKGEGLGQRLRRERKEH